MLCYMLWVFFKFRFRSRQCFKIGYFMLPFICVVLLLHYSHFNCKYIGTHNLSDHRGSLPRNQGQRYSYHENPAHRYELDHFSSLPRDHRFLSWKRDLRPPGAGPPAQTGRRAGQGATTAAEIDAAVGHHRRSFHYDDRKEFAPQYAMRGGGGRGGGSAIKRDLSPARRSFDPSIYETCDRYDFL